MQSQAQNKNQDKSQMVKKTELVFPLKLHYKHKFSNPKIELSLSMAKNPQGYPIFIIIASDGNGQCKFDFNTFSQQIQEEYPKTNFLVEVKEKSVGYVRMSELEQGLSNGEYNVSFLKQNSKNMRTLSVENLKVDKKTESSVFKFLSEKENGLVNAQEKTNAFLDFCNKKIVLNYTRIRVPEKTFSPYQI